MRQCVAVRRRLCAAQIDALDLGGLPRQTHRILDIAGHDHQAVLVGLALVDGSNGIIHRLDDELDIVGLAQTQRSLAYVIGRGSIVRDQDAIGVQLAAPAENHLTMQQTMVNAQQLDHKIFPPFQKSSSSLTNSGC